MLDWFTIARNNPIIPGNESHMSYARARAHSFTHPSYPMPTRSRQSIITTIERRIYCLNDDDDDDDRNDKSRQNVLENKQRPTSKDDL
ncbi:hypothetical protein FRB91_002754 [Serendipita sp. 411]|nr:hypothetical protein FRB91_002754 [Serendipita sp. 411]